jgi:hypothetical protein
MKKFNKYILLGTAAVALSACADLDTKYLGSYVSTEQKGEVLEQNPDMGTAAVTGIFSQATSIFTIASSHYDFGYPSVMMGMDHKTTDLVAKYSGYNWFRTYEAYIGTDTGIPSAQMWYYMYNQISTCNSVIASVGYEPTEQLNRFFLAQAAAVRAWDYWNLAQIYQKNYAGSESLPCVPILTDLNQDEAALNGAARATVQEVYDQILSDLNLAIEMLTGNTTNPSAVVSTQTKRLISLPVAYGLRARVYLTMHKYAEAAADAQTAIANFSGRPYTIDEVSTPGFTDMSDASWMWGLAVSETDDAVRGGSIVNFPSMMCTFAHGYCDQGGAWRWCGKKLYEYIPATDVRKYWFLDENRQNSHLTAEQTAWINSFITGTPSYGVDQSVNIMPYTNVKFNSYQGVIQQGLNASDIPLMRVEEMYYILAEGQAMSGNVETGRNTLVNFVKQYRDPSYSCTATTAADLQEEIWWQRRVEFWGEGLAWFDVMRLHKGIDRRGYAFPTAFVYVFSYEDDYNIVPIPNSEISTNKLISSDQNNPTYTSPKYVADVE